MGELIVLDQSGDIRVEWDPADPASVERARGEWASLKEAGMEFYAVQETKGKRVDRFSAKLGRVIAAPGVKKPVERASGKRPRAMAGGPNARAERYLRR